jgi:hypothetical protein
MAPSPVVALTLMREIVAVHPQFADRDLLNLYRLFVRTGLYGAPTSYRNRTASVCFVSYWLLADDDDMARVFATILLQWGSMWRRARRPRPRSQGAGSSSIPGRPCM